MNFRFPTIFDWLDQFAALRGLPAVYALLLLALLILFIRDWRVSLFALLGQYLLAGLLFVEVLEPRLAFVKVLTGAFVCLILYVTGRQVQGARQIGKDTAVHPPTGILHVGPFKLGVDLAFRILLVAIALLIVLVLSQRQAYWLPGIPAALSFLNQAIYGLLVLGLLALSLAGEPLRAGAGFFVALLGFELFYSAQTSAVALLFALAAINLLAAVAIAYLSQMWRRTLPAGR